MEALYSDTSLFQVRGLATFLTLLSIWRALSIVKISIFPWKALNGDTSLFQDRGLARLLNPSVQMEGPLYC
jgi:hypothetical protein